MRRILFVVCAVFGAALVASLGTLSAQAQSAEQYEPASGESTQAAEAPPPEGTASGPSGDAEAKPSDEGAREEPPANVDEFSAEGLEERVVNSVAPNPYSQVVDNATRGRFVAPGWKQVKEAGAYGGTAVAATAKTKRAASYKINVPEDGYYTVYALWPEGERNPASARFGIQSQDGLKWEEIDQTLDAGSWVRVGSYRLAAGDTPTVRLAPQGGAVADAVMVSKNVLVGANAQMVSVGDPDQLSGQGAAPSGRAATADASRAGGRGVVRTARRHLGKRYDYNHARCRPRMVREDCSCLTRNVFLSHGWRLVDSPVTQFSRYGQRIAKSRMRPGDLVFHDLNKDGDLRDHYTDHVSIWSGNGNIIHASSYFGKVVESKERYLKNYWGTKRLRAR